MFLLCSCQPLSPATLVSSPSPPHSDCLHSTSLNIVSSCRLCSRVLHCPDSTTNHSARRYLCFSCFLPCMFLVSQERGLSSSKNYKLELAKLGQQDSQLLIALWPSFPSPKSTPLLSYHTVETIVEDARAIECIHCSYMLY